MIRKKTFKNLLVYAVITIILLLPSLSYANETDNYENSSRQEPVPHLEGIMGENFWYISDVIISFDYDPKIVSEIQYFLDGTMHEYSGPFPVSNDGLYLLSWIWFDTDGNGYEGQPIGFKIDQTPPTIELSRKSGGKNKVIFTAATEDEVSKIERVEFYLDGVLNQTDSTDPYQYNWIGEEKQTVYAIAYNYAGFSVQSDNLTTKARARIRNIDLIDIIFVLMQKTFSRFYNF